MLIKINSQTEYVHVLLFHADSFTSPVLKKVLQIYKYEKNSSGSKVVQLVYGFIKEHESIPSLPMTGL